jgi:hypothetical protein
VVSRINHSYMYKAVGMLRNEDGLTSYITRKHIRSSDARLVPRQATFARSMMRFRRDALLEMQAMPFLLE